MADDLGLYPPWVGRCPTPRELRDAYPETDWRRHIPEDILNHPEWRAEFEYRELRESQGRKLSPLPDDGSIEDEVKHEAAANLSMDLMDVLLPRLSDRARAILMARLAGLSLNSTALDVGVCKATVARTLETIARLFRDYIEA